MCVVEVVFFCPIYLFDAVRIDLGHVVSGSYFPFKPLQSVGFKIEDEIIYEVLFCL
ncbi:hypothetical protein D3C77_768770 [compost metagenome]